MPMNRSKYPKDWDDFSHRIRFDRAKQQCECTGECGLHDGRDLFFPEAKRCEERNGFPAKWAQGTVVLTVAHLCHETMCVNEQHVKGLCNRCHLRYDVDLHMLHALESKGQGDSLEARAARARQAEQSRKIRESCGPCELRPMRVERKT